MKRRQWKAFLPACVLLGIALIPLFAIDLWERLGGDVSDELAGAGLAWGMVVTLPVGVFGCLALIGGLVAFFFMSQDDSK